MESKAFKLAGLENTPVNSYKGYFGHTLGGAGVVETAVLYECLKQNLLPASRGYKECGTPVALNVPAQTKDVELNSCLKTASGFGGVNACLALVKEK
jgi:3-oxoacyl-[acyl-carrier-protein] synthase-1